MYRFVEEVREAAGQDDDGGPLLKAAVAAAVVNPLAGQGYVPDLSPIVDASGGLGTTLGTECLRLLGGVIEGYGKGAVVGTLGEQEHGNATLTSVFGNAFRDAIGGGDAWITSATKVSGFGARIDVPLAYKDDIWVRSHYDAIEVTVPDAPYPDEIVVIVVGTNRGRINARLGGKSKAEVERTHEP